MSDSHRDVCRAGASKQCSCTDLTRVLQIWLGRCARYREVGAELIGGLLHDGVLVSCPSCNLRPLSTATMPKVHVCQVLDEEMRTHDVLYLFRYAQDGVDMVVVTIVVWRCLEGGHACQLLGLYTGRLR